MIVQDVKTVVIPAAKDLYMSAESIVDIFPYIFRDPMTAVGRIGKGVMR